jgi:hypothetical protein
VMNAARESTIAAKSYAKAERFAGRAPETRITPGSRDLMPRQV